MGYVIWAEENSNLSSTTAGGNQFSWGNGGTGANNQLAIPPGGDGTVVGLSIQAEASTTGTVELVKNGTLTGSTVSLSAARVGTSVVSVAVAAGDTLSFRTISGTGGTGIVVAAYIEQTVDTSSSSGGMSTSEIQNLINQANSSVSRNIGGRRFPS